MTASLDLLTKGAAKSVPAVVEAVDVEVDVDKMSSQELDALVEENGLDVVAEFKGWPVEQKRAYLNEKFGGAADAAQSFKNEPAAQPEAEAPKTKAKKASAGKGKKGKAVSTEVAIEGEIVEADPIQDLVHEIENMKESDAIKAVDLLVDQSGANFIKLGGVLTRVQANGWFNPYTSFQEYVENRLGLKFRLAGYYMQCYNALANGGIPYAKVAGLGWTKLALIASMITLDNVDEWVSIAKSQNALTLNDTVKKAKAKAKAAGNLTGDETSTSPVTSVTFKPHEDQRATILAAIEKAKEAAGTQHATVALEFICLEYLGTLGLGERLKTVGVEKATNALAEAFPEWDFTASPVGADGAGDSEG